MQLKEISGAIGLSLYEVVGRKVYLTDVGHRLAATARAMTQSWDAFGQEVDGIKGLTRGKLRVAVVSTAKYFMPRLVGSFCRDHPQIDVALEILNRDGVIERLRDNRDDLYIMSMPPADMELHVEAFMPNPIVVIAPTTDPLGRSGPVTLGQLSGCRFILREKGSGTRMTADRHFARVRFRPHVRLELGSNEAVKEFVAGGLGLGVISRHALHGNTREHGVRIVEVKGFPLPSAWHLVHRSAKNLSPLGVAFKQHVLRQVSRRRLA
jgi:DNA-binding transcriptional LysR family regulator